MLALAACQEKSSALSEAPNGAELRQVAPPEGACLDATVTDRDPDQAGVQAECSVQDRLPMGPSGRIVLLHACPGAKPCWEVLTDATCMYSGQRLRIDRDGPPPSGTQLELRCQTCKLGQPGCPGGSSTRDAGGSARTDAGGSAAVPPAPGLTRSEQLLDVSPARKLDLLFMIDNSNSMKEEQDSLKANFPRFISELRKIPGPNGLELPDLRIAIVSSDVGAGPESIGNCFPQGDRGRFQVKSGCGLDKNLAHWLAVQENGAKTNFTGRLEDVFSCMASLGVDGCGYEHQLQSIRAALSTMNPENQGFLRPDAYLGIVILSDEDDCSAPPNTDLFLSMIDGHNPNLRCALEGHTCQGRMVPPQDFSAPLAECRATEAGKTKLIPVEEVVRAVRAAKGGADGRIVVGAIIGWNEQPGALYEIRKNIPGGGGATSDGALDLQPTCRSANGVATPAIRLKAFADAFGPDGAGTHGICQSNLSGPLATIGKKIADRLGNTCLAAPPVDTAPATAGLQVDCQIAERIPQGTSYREQPLPACPGPRPCWKLTQEPACSASGTRLEVERDVPASLGALLVTRCLTCTQAGDPRCPRP